jgi:hypothetical protein
MPALIFLMPLLVLCYAFRRSPGWLLLALYLPALLLVPDTFHTVTNGIPKISVNQAIIVTILPFALARHGAGLRLCVSDALVLALVLCTAVSEYQAAGYKEAQNLTFRMISAALAPYLCARLVIGPERLDVALARRIVALMAAVVLVCSFEFKFGYNPFLALLGRLFPGQGEGWVTTFRYGFARIAGPFVHAILAGIMMALAYRLQRWLQWGGHWEARFAALPSLPWSKASVLSAILLAGAVMTFARGPWLGGLAAALLVMAGRARRRRQMLAWLGVAALLVLPLAYLAMQAYLDIRPGAAMTTSQESALYRKVLLDKYTAIAFDHAWLGWGRNTWPKVDGMSSIDNYFLLLTLMHGVLATLALLGLFAWLTVRLCCHAYAGPPQANSLTLTMAGILLAVLLSLLTVYLGEQVMPALFLLFGWSESLLGRAAPGAAAPAPAPRPAPRFRVMR